MITKGVTVLFAFFLVSACCTKKGCPSWELPSIMIHFNNAKAGDEVTVYRFVNKVLLDSAIHDASVNLTLAPFTDYTENSAVGKEFVIRHDGKSDSFREFDAIFMQEKIVCNKCFPFGKERVTIWKYRDFSYSHNSQRRPEQNIELDF
jgi:hypothetical protein